MPSRVHLAQFLCSSLSTFLDVEEIWVSFKELPEPVAMAVATDTAGPASRPPRGEESLQRRARLHAMWPGTYGSVGAAVQRAPAGAPGALDVTFNNGVGRVVVSRGRGFENGEISTFTTMATSIAEVLAGNGA
jgi:hypothetical protein